MRDQAADNHSQAAAAKGVPAYTGLFFLASAEGYFASATIVFTVAVWSPGSSISTM
jgi:hypothetical protein